MIRVMKVFTCSSELELVIFIVRYLFFADAIALTRANSNGFFAPGVGPIFLKNLGCRGNETNLFGCIHSRVVFCSDREDAGVVCPQG